MKPVIDYANLDSFLVMADWHEERGEMGEAEERKKEKSIVEFVYARLTEMWAKGHHGLSVKFPIDMTPWVVFLHLGQGNIPDVFTTTLSGEGSGVPRDWHYHGHNLKRGHFKAKREGIAAGYAKQTVSLYRKVAETLPVWQKRVEMYRVFGYLSFDQYFATVEVRTNRQYRTLLARIPINGHAYTMEQCQTCIDIIKRGVTG
jgi:hypothetical protein